MKYLALITCLMAPFNLSAEVKTFEKGQLLTMTARYDSENDRFLSDVLVGEKHTSWRVDGITSKDVALTLVKGTYDPWRSDDDGSIEGHIHRPHRLPLRIHHDA